MPGTVSGWWENPKRFPLATPLFSTSSAGRSLFGALAATLGIEGDQLHGAIRQLIDVGFLEELRESWKVPMLYRDGLDVRQGKAFASDQPITGED